MLHAYLARGVNNRRHVSVAVTDFNASCQCDVVFEDWTVVFVGVFVLF
jgi:hypothetical protein